jgi:hypothetical protein
LKFSNLLQDVKNLGDKKLCCAGQRMTRVAKPFLFTLLFKVICIVAIIRSIYGSEMLKNEQLYCNPLPEKPAVFDTFSQRMSIWSKTYKTKKPARNESNRFLVLLLKDLNLGPFPMNRDQMF